MTLVDGSDVVVELVHLAAREAAAPRDRLDGQAIVAVSQGLVQVRAGDQTPAIRDGEVLLADCAAVRDWRNLGDREAIRFWIVVALDRVTLPGPDEPGPTAGEAPKVSAPPHVGVSGHGRRAARPVGGSDVTTSGSYGSSPRGRGPRRARAACGRADRAERTPARAGPAQELLQMRLLGRRRAQRPDDVEGAVALAAVLVERQIV